jgi:hypothetical protein
MCVYSLVGRGHEQYNEAARCEAATDFPPPVGATAPTGDVPSGGTASTSVKISGSPTQFFIVL